MSGNGNTLGNQILNELRSALGLLFKSVVCYTAECTLRCNLSQWYTGLGARLGPPVSWELSIGLNPEARLASFHMPKTQTVVAIQAHVSPSVTLAQQAPIVHATACQFKVEGTQGISFENLGTPQSSAWTSALAPLTCHDLLTSLSEKPATQGIAVQGLSRTQVVQKPCKIAPRKAKMAPGWAFALPFVKKTIPLHRFSLMTKETFRLALAEKAQTHPERIQLKGVYSTINLPQFQNFTPDAQGNLHCHPRSEVVEPLRQQALRIPTNLVYLVFGTRLDTRDVIQAWVPMDTIDTAGRA